MMNHEQHLKSGDRIILTIKRLGINGEGIGYDKKLAIFVNGALPEEVVEVNIEQVFNNRAIASIIQIKKASKHRVKPFCPVYETCGGCQLQHLDYQMTLIEKRNLIVQAFERFLPVKIANQRIKNTIGMDHPTYYRNKASLPVRKTKKNKIGMYAAGSTKFIPIDACPIQDDRINKIMQTILDLMSEIGIDAYDEKYRKGYLTNLIVRVATEDEAQVTFVCHKEPNRLLQLAEALMIRQPLVKSVFRVLEKKGAHEFFNDSLMKVTGSDLITETLNEQIFMLEPDAFFQLNTTQAHVFFKTMRDMAKLNKSDIVMDAYAGSAPISHYIAADCKKVYAIEANEASVKSAKRSLKENHIKNVEVIHSKFKDVLDTFKPQQINVMFFDPPRVGLGLETIELIKKARPKRIVYGSCNPSTLAKDIAALIDLYVLDQTIPIDMFPYTAQVESVTLLSLK